MENISVLQTMCIRLEMIKVYNYSRLRETEGIRLSLQPLCTHNIKVAVCNNLYLPFRSDSFDVVISIAVIHHFSTREHRLQALNGKKLHCFLLLTDLELVRILKPGGKLLVYVWAMEQENKTFGQQDVLVPWNMEKKYVEQILDQVQVGIRFNADLRRLKEMKRRR